MLKRVREHIFRSEERARAWVAKMKKEGSKRQWVVRSFMMDSTHKFWEVKERKKAKPTHHGLFG